MGIIDKAAGTGRISGKQFEHQRGIAHHRLFGLDHGNFEIKSKKRPQGIAILRAGKTTRFKNGRLRLDARLRALLIPINNCLLILLAQRRFILRRHLPGLDDLDDCFPKLEIRISILLCQDLGKIDLPLHLLAPVTLEAGIL